MITNIRHSGIVTKDLNKALHFYVDLLGFQVIKEATEELEFGEKILNIPKTKLTYVKLLVGDPILYGCLTHLNMIELYYMELPHRIGEVNKRLYKSYGGFNHIALTVDNIDKLYTKLRKAKIKFYSKPTLDPSKTHKLCFCRDYDDNMLELCEEL